MCVLILNRMKKKNHFPKDSIKKLQKFCSEPSGITYQKIPKAVRDNLYKYSLLISSEEIKGNYRMAHRIKDYHEKNRFRRWAITPTFWRNMENSSKEDEFDYDVIEKDQIVYRGSKIPIVLEDWATYFALEISNANLYLPVDEITIGYMGVFQLNQTVRLFRLDSVENINKLLQKTFHIFPGVYKDIKRMFVTEGMQRDTQSIKKYIKQQETADKPIQFSELYRNSHHNIDFRFANWLCEQGFQGYSAGRFKIGMSIFLEEIVLCHPTRVLKELLQHKMKRINSRTWSGRQRMDMEVDLIQKLLKDDGKK